MSAQYAVLTVIIETNNKGIKGTYPTVAGNRYLWPKALGQTNGQDRVLCVELKPDPANPGHFINEPKKTWRCFVVEDLTLVPADEFVVAPGERPVKWRVNHLRRQSCVEDVEFFR